MASTIPHAWSWLRTWGINWDGLGNHCLWKLLLRSVQGVLDPSHMQFGSASTPELAWCAPPHWQLGNERRGQRRGLCSHQATALSNTQSRVKAVLTQSDSPRVPSLLVSTHPALTKCSRIWKPSVGILILLACNQQILRVFKINAVLLQLLVFTSDKVV